MIPVYCIHLPHIIRHMNIAGELQRAGLTDVRYIHAKEPMQGFAANNYRRNARGEYGCALSHLKAISQAIADKQEVALFIEDDIKIGELLPVFQWIECNDFDVLYLGGHPRGPAQMVTSRVARVGTFSCAEAYIMPYHAMVAFLPFWCDRAGQKDAMFDFILGEFAAKNQGYAAYPPVTHQDAGWSHIGNKFDDKRELMARGWKENLVA
jgi:hypothetical protein